MNRKNISFDDPDYIYKKLAGHLDELPAGFPSTGNGLDLKLLRKLFTGDEARLAVHLTLIPEPVNVIALRAGQQPEKISDKLDDMARKGLIYSIKKDGQSTRYMANQIVIGIWEYHVNSLDPELVEHMSGYIPLLMDDAWKIPQLRTIPVNRSLNAKTEVMRYEDAEHLLTQAKKIVLAPCICRKEKKIIGEGCGRPEESCLILGSATDYYLRNQMGREITLDQAREVLRQADEHGLVLQPGNARKASNICCCCGCCCGVLRTLKLQPRPVDHVYSAFYAVTNNALCDNCELCAERCQMDAISHDQGYAEINLDRCIGCGLCVPTCPAEALSMVRKPDREQASIPATNRDLYIALGRLRGKLNWLKIVKLLALSKIDRWRANRIYH